MQNFMQIPPRGLPGKWVKYTQKFFYPYTFFSETHLQVRLFGGFLRAMARMCLLGVKKFEINI